MKILVLCSQAKNTGAKLRAEYIFRYLKKAGADADYILPPLNSMPFMFDFLLTIFYYFFKLMNRRPDIVYILKPYPNTVLPALMLKPRGAKLIIDIDDLDHGYRSGAVSHLIKWMQQKLTKAADLITSHNDELIKLIKKEHPAYRDKIYKLKQCVDLEIFSSRAVDKVKVKYIKKEYSGKIILFYMAHLNIASCLDEIIDAVSRLKRKNTVLLVAGGGPMYGNYKRLAERKAKSMVVFLGPMPQHQAVNYIAASDLCLVYYRNSLVNKYRASMKIREYLALSKNIVADSVGEIKNFRKLVYLSAPAVGAYAAEIEKRTKTLDNRAKKGYKFIQKEYNWDREIRLFYVFLKKSLLQI